MKPVRRVIVGQNANDRSYIVKDEKAENIDRYITNISETVSINLWLTQTTPVVINCLNNSAHTKFPFLPTENGTI